MEDYDFTVFENNTLTKQVISNN